jgi:uncharacterized membrane protein YphA (DoxX/SURF4 family)
MGPATEKTVNDKQGLSVLKSSILAGMLITPLRWGMAWIFFSAFWRRIVLVPEKLDPSSAAYVGHKFNHFLPHALWIKDMIGFLVTHEHTLYVFLIAFTIIEGLVGLSLAFGLFTRLGGIGATCLSWGILMGSGWLGSTCVDEWQIGTMGIAAGVVIFLAGSGPWSLDRLWQKWWPNAARMPGLRFFTSGPLGGGRPRGGLKVLAFILALFAIGWSLYTNQAFQGGVWGKLHNPSKKPAFEIPNATLASDGHLTITLYRINGPDSYGAFIVKIDILDESGKVVESFDARQLSSIPMADIQNRYLNKLHPGPYGLEAPLGSYSTVSIAPDSAISLSSGTYKVEVEDVSGAKWSTNTSVP